jgi:hypothetical protein
MHVSSRLLLANRPASAGHVLELHVEHTPNKFVRAAWGKTNAAGAATLQWKVGPQFPLGKHRWFVNFPGHKEHKRGHTALGHFHVVEPQSRVLYFGLAPVSLYKPGGPLTRRETMDVRALLSLPHSPRGGHVLELHVERTPGNFEKVGSTRTNASGLATLKWKPEPLFPAGKHQAYVRFPGNKEHKPSQTVMLTFTVP